MNQLEVVINQMVSHQSLVSADFRVLEQGSQTVEVELRREHAFEGIEEEVAGALEDLLR
jgi:hypothetical protein